MSSCAHKYWWYVWVCVLRYLFIYLYDFTTLTRYNSFSDFVPRPLARLICPPACLLWPTLPPAILLSCAPAYSAHPSQPPTRLILCRFRCLSLRGICPPASLPPRSGLVGRGAVWQKEQQYWQHRWHICRRQWIIQHPHEQGGLRESTQPLKVPPFPPRSCSPLLSSPRWLLCRPCKHGIRFHHQEGCICSIGTECTWMISVPIDINILREIFL